MGNFYSAAFSAVTIANADGTQDLFEITAPATSRVVIHEVDLAQYSDFGDAQAEILSLLFMRGHTTTGSGGSAVTPGVVDGYLRAAASTVAANNTTLASAGSPVTLWATGWHLQAGFIWPASMRGKIVIPPSTRFVIRMNSAVADDITANGSVLFEETGKSPVS